MQAFSHSVIDFSNLHVIGIYTEEEMTETDCDLLIIKPFGLKLQ